MIINKKSPQTPGLYTTVTMPAIVSISFEDHKLLPLVHTFSTFTLGMRELSNQYIIR